MVHVNRNLRVLQTCIKHSGEMGTRGVRKAKGIEALSHSDGVEKADRGLGMVPGVEPAQARETKEA